MMSEGVGEVGDDVHVAAALDLVEPPVHHRLDLAAHALDHPRGERAIDEPAQARVVRRITK
jgi:hypothetical protein